MSLENWHRNGWLRPHQTNRGQIADLFAIVERDLADARTARLSSDWQFGADQRVMSIFLILTPS